jgi:unsaturated chondroitin disaccharide hydrolase
MEQHSPADLIDGAQDAVRFAQQQVRQLVTTYPDYFPLYTVAGKWKHGKQAWTNWCEGFLAGMLWIFARRTGDTWWHERAEHYSLLIEHRKDDRNVHDLGFLFWSSWKRWFDLTGDPRLNDVVIHAGRTLAMRFNEQGRYLRSFLAPDSVFIDIMMNVEIIFYAAQQRQDVQLRRTALEHCLTTRRYLVRGDGSVSHEGIFDLDTGTFLRQSTQQGWRDDSSWARGQAWAIYGFGRAYACTGDVRFLDTARRCADFYSERTPSHGIPPNDWEEPEPQYPFESSAAAIAACGFLRLAELVSDAAQTHRYRTQAWTILATLCTPGFLASERMGWEGILLHGIYHQRHGLGVDESVLWGDYFFVEALDLLLDSAAPGGIQQ